MPHPQDPEFIRDVIARWKGPPAKSALAVAAEVGVSKGVVVGILQRHAMPDDMTARHKHLGGRKVDGRPATAPRFRPKRNAAPPEQGTPAGEPTPPAPPVMTNEVAGKPACDGGDAETFCPAGLPASPSVAPLDEAAAPAPPPRIAAPPPPVHLASLRARPGVRFTVCQWPSGIGERFDSGWCHAELQPGQSPYCARHRAIAYRPFVPKKRNDEE